MIGLHETFWKQNSFRIPSHSPTDEKLSVAREAYDSCFPRKSKIGGPGQVRTWEILGAAVEKSWSRIDWDWTRPFYFKYASWNAEVALLSGLPATVWFVSFVVATCDSDHLLARCKPGLDFLMDAQKDFLNHKLQALGLLRAHHIGWKGIKGVALPCCHIGDTVYAPWFLQESMEFTCSQTQLR